MVCCPQCSAPCSTDHRFCAACGAQLERAREDPVIGSTLPGGYRVTHLVGVGGMGRVYCAEQVALGRTVAVKIVHPHLSDDELAVARFLNEARAASRLSHPNSVAIFDFGRTQEGHPYLVMEYLRGRDLRRVSEDEGPLPIGRVVDVLRQTLAALAEAHALGIVHRDLKPDNIVLEPLRSGMDFVKVVDFGLAKILHDSSQSIPPPGTQDARIGPPLTQPGLVCGTPEYMSPEQGRGDPLDGRSDLYSVGIVLYELLTGRVPFPGDSPTKTLLSHLTEAPRDPRDVAPERRIPRPLADLAIRSLAKARDARIQSAREFADALERALVEAHEPAASEPAPTARCRACGAPSASKQKFCGDCGTAIGTRGPTETPGPPTSGPSPDSQSATPAQRVVRDGRGPAPLPLISGDDALRWLDARYHEGGAMFAAAHIIGEAGAGKTRIVAEALARWAARGDVVVSVGPDPSCAQVGDAAVRAAIRELAAIPPGADPDAWRDARSEARAGLEVLFGTRELSLPARARRAAVAEALRWALERAGDRASPGLVVLAVDDIDFMDGTSANAFADVLIEPPVVPAVVVVTYSPATEPAGEPLPGEAWTLGPLPYRSFAEQLPPRLVAAGTRLLPLHLEQLRAWADENSDAPPARLADLIVARAERLPKEALHVLQALAVWGDDANPQVLRTLLGATDLGEALEALDRARLVVVGDQCIRIGHPLVRRVVFASIPAGRKRDLFGQAAKLRPAAPLEVRARQATYGESGLEALSLLDALSARRASQGDLAGSVGALRRALDLARRELHRGEIDDPMTAVLVFARKLGDALAAFEKWPDAEGVLREALDSAPPASEQRVHLLGALAHVANARSHPSDARRYLEEAIRVARQSDARELMPMLERLEKDIAVA